MISGTEHGNLCLNWRESPDTKAGEGRVWEADLLHRSLSSRVSGSLWSAGFRPSRLASVSPSKYSTRRLVGRELGSPVPLYVYLEWEKDDGAAPPRRALKAARDVALRNPIGAKASDLSRRSFLEGVIGLSTLAATRRIQAGEALEIVCARGPASWCGWTRSARGAAAGSGSACSTCPSYRRR
jgi:hypothetical protein